MNNDHMVRIHRAQAELDSARREMNTLGRFASASRSERAAFRLEAAEHAMNELLLAA